MTGIEKALLKASGGGEITPEGFKKIAELLAPISLQFVYNAKRKGFLPPERARVVSDAYGVPLAELVSPQVAALLNTSN